MRSNAPRDEQVDVSIHPCEDGNGRVSRILQSLVLARERRVAPEFGSIEEDLRRHTATYYEALQAVQGGRYQPDREAARWVRFCVQAHIEQTGARLAQLQQAGARWAHLEDLVERRGWPDRLVVALEQALFGQLERSVYAAEAGVSPATASADVQLREGVRRAVREAPG